MKKTIKYAKNGALICGIINAALNLIKQYTRTSKDSKFKLNWTELLNAFIKGALYGGTGGALIGGVKDIANEYEEPLNTSKMLNNSTSIIRLDKNSNSYIKLSNKADAVVELFYSKLGSSLGEQITRIGSTEANTALSEKFDIDLTVFFKPNAHQTISEMYYDVLDFIEENYDDSDLYEIREQRRSIGLIFELEEELYKVDVVPVKQNSNKKAGYLLNKRDSYFESDGKVFTNIDKLELNLSSKQKKVLISLKKWKNDYKVPISSHLLGQFIPLANKWKEQIRPKNLTEELLMVVKYISCNILTINVTSPENRNNDLTDFSYSDKNKIKKACDKVLSDYEYQPNSILDYFSTDYEEE